MNVWETPLLRMTLHLVSSSYHQTVHDIHRVVTDSLQYEPKEVEDLFIIYLHFNIHLPAVCAVQQTGRITA